MSDIDWSRPIQTPADDRPEAERLFEVRTEQIRRALILAHVTGARPPTSASIKQRVGVLTGAVPGLRYINDGREIPALAPKAKGQADPAFPRRGRPGWSPDFLEWLSQEVRRMRDCGDARSDRDALERITARPEHAGTRWPKRLPSILSAYRNRHG